MASAVYGWVMAWWFLNAAAYLTDMPNRAEGGGNMTLTNEDLLALSNLLDVKLKPIDSRLTSLETKVDVIDSRLTSLETKVDVIDSRLTSLELKVDKLEAKVDTIDSRLTNLELKVDKLEAKVDAIDSRLTNLELKVDKLEAKVDAIDSRLTSLELKVDKLETKADTLEIHIENVTDKNIALLAENYVPAARQFEKASYKIESLQADSDIIKKVLGEHSEKLQRIS